MVEVVAAADMVSAKAALGPAEVVVVCDANGETAAQAADGLAPRRAAVFVGDISQAADRRAAEELAAELEAGIRPDRD